MSDLPRPLLLIVILLVLGGCMEGSTVIRQQPGWIFFAISLVGRIFAIGGILSQSRVGMYFAIGFFGLIVALAGVVMLASGIWPAVLGIIVPGACMIYLIAIVKEYD